MLEGRGDIRALSMYVSPFWRDTVVDDLLCTIVPIIAIRRPTFETFFEAILWMGYMRLVHKHFAAASLVRRWTLDDRRRSHVHQYLTTTCYVFQLLCVLEYMSRHLVSQGRERAGFKVPLFGCGASWLVASSLITVGRHQMRRAQRARRAGGSQQQRVGNQNCL